MSRKTRDFRDVDGILLLNKPRGLSSNQALQRARFLYRARKAGHCGSLDPLATGVLPVCFGQATRFSGYLLGAGKAYRASCRLGQTTASGDAEGEVLQTREVDVDAAQVETVLARFRGPIEQVPPMYSALRHEGKRLYQLAREGQSVDRPSRPVTIYRLELLDLEAGRLDIDVACSKGTYIRTLAEDIGAALGCGAHLASLHRYRVEDFVEDDAHGLDELETLQHDDPEQLDRLLLPVDATLARFPELELDADRSRDMRHGKAVFVDPPGPPGLYRIRACEGVFLGLGELAENGQLKAKRLMNTAR